jgi:hydrogenase-4 component F
VIIWALLLIPTCAGLAAMLLPCPAVLRRGLLVATALAHLALTTCAWVAKSSSELPLTVLNGWIGLDDASLLFLSITSVLFLAAALYAVGYLSREQSQARDFVDGDTFTDAPEARFVGCLLLFLATMTLVTASMHMGLLWVAIEATTLASAPLIYYHRHHRSLEATWKYLLICSVGIALALLGNFFLAVAAKGSPGLHMTVEDLLTNATKLDSVWLRSAFMLLLVGYGTKMGLAPMHTWLPDAHSEAPSVVSALLSGALLNCAFLGILRAHSIMSAAGLQAFSGQLLTIFGLVSMIVAAIFIIEQADFKRLLAYSSVEHMGILALGAGLGGLAGFGAMFHAVNHSLTKAMLFLIAGNILAAYRTKNVKEIIGLAHRLPTSGVLWIAGFLAICGSPPFGLFTSELIILKGALQTGHVLEAVIFLAVLGVIFVAMAKIVLAMAYGKPASNLDTTTRHGEPILATWPAVALGFIVLVLGVYIPPACSQTLARAAKILGIN